jgi:anti-sigma factor RsiW
LNEDLKAYIDGELPPDAADRLRAALAVDPLLRQEAEHIRRLGDAVRGLPLPEPVGQAATLAALSRRQPLWRVWTPALAGCAAVVAFVAFLPNRLSFVPVAQPAVYESRPQAAAPAEAEPEDAAKIAEPPLNAAPMERMKTAATSTSGGLTLSRPHPDPKTERGQRKIGGKALRLPGKTVAP